jgi:hypothetical protein
MRSGMIVLKPLAAKSSTKSYRAYELARLNEFGAEHHKPDD